MSTRTHDTKPPNSNCGENSFTSKALEAFQMLSRALNLQVPLYAYTLFTIIFAILFQITLKSRKRIRTLETERQGFEDVREELRGEIEALREEMRSVREVDREEKLCLVETVKQVLRQGNGTAKEDNMVDEAYSGSQIQKTPRNTYRGRHVMSVVFACSLVETRRLRGRRYLRWIGSYTLLSELLLQRGKGAWPRND
ncbi:hypothetical protein BKA61DRAFT_159994 [Leptodontidium sp. MPI-SDFR-AT-0119]|nr:hypothetical protein BKA61DRAFT_159994 [Leptodontidium sp. MPI-SDFR-AT-0119]